MLDDKWIEHQLSLLQQKTESDVVALSILEPGHRKMIWQQLLGVKSIRTSKVKQSATAGITGNALRTGVMQSFEATSEKERACVGEAIVLTEKLSHIYVWPIAFSSSSFSYQGVILIGRRDALSYTDEQIQISSSIIAEFMNQYKTELV